MYCKSVMLSPFTFRLLISNELRTRMARSSTAKTKRLGMSSNPARKAWIDDTAFDVHEHGFDRFDILYGRQIFPDLSALDKSHCKRVHPGEHPRMKNSKNNGTIIMQ